ncbi:hypothetical protein KKF38_04720 [Patescibacteria group bacterium]|nr:hypothetical protein [Patescibacteria group bacterium]
MGEKIIGSFPEYGFEITASSFRALEEIKKLLAGVFEVADEARAKIGELTATVKELTTSAEKELTVARKTKSKFEKLITIAKKKLDVAREVRMEHEELLAIEKKKIRLAREKAEAAISKDELDTAEMELENSSAIAKKLVARLKELKGEEAEIQAELDELISVAGEADAVVKNLTADTEKNMNVFEGFDLTDPSGWKRMIKFALRREVEKLLKNRGDVKIEFVGS